MNPKKIGIVVNDLVQGGVSQFLINYCKQSDYAAFSYQLIVLGGKKEPSIEQALIELGIKIHDFSLPYYPETTAVDQFLNRLKVAFKARRHDTFQAFIKSLELDLLFTHCHFQFLPYLKETSLPVVFVAHTVISNKPANFLNRILQRNAFVFYFKNTLVITVSKSVTDFFHEFRLAPKLINLYHQPNKTIVSGKQIEYREKIQRIIYVARVSVVKNHLELLKAWKILNRKDMTLQLVGPNDLNPENQAKLNEYLSENVEFLGNRSDIPELLAQADIAVFPSKVEGLPLALLEKMGCGLPVVTSDIPQLTAVVTDEVNGLTYSLGNPQELADKLQELISDCEKRRKLGSAARQTVLDSFAYAPGEPLIVYEKKINELF